MAEKLGDVAARVLEQIRREMEARKQAEQRK